MPCKVPFNPKASFLLETALQKKRTKRSSQRIFSQQLVELANRCREQRPSSQVCFGSLSSRALSQQTPSQHQSQCCVVANKCPDCLNPVPTPGPSDPMIVLDGCQGHYGSDPQMLKATPVGWGKGHQKLLHVSACYMPGTGQTLCISHPPTTKAEVTAPTYRWGNQGSEGPPLLPSSGSH